MTIRADLEAAMETSGRKVSKREARYGGGMDDAHCALCRHFKAPDACQIVKGTINPQAWCKYFERKRPKQR
jgi:hypothetical protein